MLAWVFQVILTNSVGTWWLLMIFKRNSVNLLMQLNAILELFSLLCTEGKKCKACPQISYGGDMTLRTRISGLCIYLPGSQGWELLTSFRNDIF